MAYLENDDQQYGGQILLQYLLDLFTGSGKDAFPREQVLVILNIVKNDTDIFDPEVIAAFDQVHAECPPLFKREDQ